MKRLLITIISIGFFPIASIAASLDCHTWPMNMAEVWMKNTGIVNINNLDESKTEITLLASEKKGKDIHKFTILFFMINKVIRIK